MPYVDPTANAHISLDAFHGRIHEGTAFHWSKRFDGVLTAAVVDTVIVANGTAHLTGFLDAGGSGRVDFMEVNSFTGGTSLGSVRRNGFVSGPSSLDILHTASINVAGDNFVETIVAGGGSPGNPSGGKTGDFAEFILPPGTYGIRFTNTSGGTIDVALQLEYYQPGNAGA